MAHTPGPWIFTEGDRQRRGTSTIATKADPDFTIGYVLCESINEEQRKDDIANARLIAAAPELLEACKAILALPAKERSFVEPEMLLEEVIAKAEGGAQ